MQSCSYFKGRVLAVGSPLPLILRPEALVVPPLPATFPRLDDAAVPGLDAEVACLSEPFDDDGALSRKVVSVVLQDFEWLRLLCDSVRVPFVQQDTCATLLTGMSSLHHNPDGCLPSPQMAL